MSSFKKNHNNKKKPTDKAKKTPHVAKSVIAKQVEARELESCKSRVLSEFKLFSKLNPGAFQKSLKLRNEPKLVKLDSEFASKARIPKTTKGKEGVKQIKSATDLYAKAADQFAAPTSLNDMPIDHLREFNTLPISTRTKKGLADHGYKQCTRVQHASLPSSLAQQDLFVLSCTGSGKTLAFVVPLLETLWQQRWSRDLGLGALIIEPTRELALQTFHVLRRIGAYHDFSAGLLIGGTSFEDERRAISGMNILVCTPGRLLHHLDKSSGLDLSNLVSLVIDECDHLLDIGFSEQFESIAPLLPSKKKLAKTLAETSDETLKKQLKEGHPGFHTMLFSATISPVVQKFAKRILSPDLRLISLTGSSGNNPDNLAHRFLVVPETEKVRTLFEFLRVHRSNKTVVFVSSARQVAYLYDLFRGLSVKSPVHYLHSKMSDNNRTQEYYQFQQQKFGVLICTDVAARGLDLTGVSWVVHFDCPTSVTQYTHRSGRTARLKGTGTNLLMLTPHQLRFAHFLHLHNPDLTLQQVGLPQFRSEFYAKMAQLYSEKPDIKRRAERAVTAYMQHIMHEHTDNSDLLHQYAPDETAYTKLVSQTGRDLVQVASKAGPWLQRLKKLAPAETAAFLITLFDITKYDVIGLCRAYGLKSVPVIVSTEDQEAVVEEGEEVEQQEKAQEKDDDGDQSLSVLTRVNVELEAFIKRTRLLEAAQKNQAQQGEVFVKSKVQPDAVTTVGNHSIDLAEDDVVCDVFTTWSDDEIDQDEREEQLNGYTKNNRFEQLKQRYQELDQSDKEYVKKMAVRKRTFKMNMVKLDRLKKLGYNLSLDQLEDMLLQKKLGNDVNLSAFRTDMVDGGEDEEAIFDELGQSDDDDDDEDAEGGDDHEGGFSFGVGDDGDDSDSDSGNEFHQMMKREAAQKKQQHPQQPQRSLLDETSDDDDSDDDDDDDDDEPLPPSTTLKKNGKMIHVNPQAQTSSSKPTNKKQSTAALLGMDSDQDDDDVPQSKPINAKQAFSLNETSDEESDEEPPAPVLNKNGKRAAGSQLAPNSKNAPKAPTKPSATEEKPKQRTMRKL